MRETVSVPRITIGVLWLLGSALIGSSPLSAQSPNDACANAITITSGSSTTFDLTGNTNDGPAQICNDGGAYADLWFSWTADCTGTASIDTCGSAYDSVMAAYGPGAACPPVGGTEVDCDDFSCGGNSALQFPCGQGETYLILVSGWAGAAGTGVINATCVPAALPNDDCAGATPITSGTPQSFTNIGSTQDGPIQSCNNQGSPDVWFTWTASCTGSAYIATCGSAFDTVMSIYGPNAACVPTIADEVGCSDLGCGVDASELTFPCVAGETYLIQLAGWAGATGTGTLTADCFDVAPANDDCANAIALATGVPEMYSTLAAAVDGPDGSCTNGPTNNVWFTWTAPITGTGYLNTCANTTYDSTLTAYAPGFTCPPDPLNELGCADIGCGGTFSELLFPCVAGETYLIQAGGWGGAAGDGEIVADAFLDPVTATTCTLNPANLLEVTIDWTLPASGYAGDITVEITGAATDTIVVPGTTTSTVYTAPAGTFGTITACVTGSDGTGFVSTTECCTSAIGVPTIANDLCFTPAPILSNTPTTYDTTMATPDGPVPGCNVNPSNDLWYTWTADCDGEAYIRTCGGASYDTVISVYDGTACPPAVGTELDCSDAGCGALLSESFVQVTAGQVLLIQVGGWNGEFGTGTLEVSCDPCGDLGTATCSYDCVTDTLSLAWVDNVNATTGYTIFENGVTVGTVPAGTSTFNLAAPSPGTNTYSVEATCIQTGNPLTVDCTASVVAPPGAGTDLVLALESLGGTGAIDSAAAMMAALTANGRTPVSFAAPDFDLYPCLDLTAYENIWVMTGSFGADYRPTTGELDALALYLIGGIGNVYFEGGDHWGFQHVPSTLDAFDGVDETLVVDGDDSFTSMDGLNATTAMLDLSGFAAVPYASDNALNDWTDQLALSVSDLEVSSAESIWLNDDDDPVITEPAYITGVATVHGGGTRMIVTSWEFGGFSTDPLERDALAAAYLEFFDPTIQPPTGLFSRGDANADGSRNIADAISILGVLFPQSGPVTPPCEKALDANDDGGLNIADAIALLGVLFPNTSPPPQIPAPDTCGTDPTADSLTCDNFPPCP